MKKIMYKGIFWIRDDLPSLEDSIDYCIQIPCDSKGNVDIETQISLTAKSGNTHNHKYYWDNMLDSKLKNNKPFNYYPRGRVEISNNKATIYLNPNIYTEEVKKFIIDVFNLYQTNGIKEVRMIVDNSEHYQCHSH